MRIKFDNKKKSNIKKWNWKTTKLNLIQLKDWGSLCNFAKPTHLLRGRKEQKEGWRKTLYFLCIISSYYLFICLFILVRMHARNFLGLYIFSSIEPSSYPGISRYQLGFLD